MVTIEFSKNELETIRKALIIARAELVKEATKKKSQDLLKKGKLIFIAHNMGFNRSSFEMFRAEVTELLDVIEPAIKKSK